VFGHSDISTLNDQNSESYRKPTKVIKSYYPRYENNKKKNRYKEQEHHDATNFGGSHFPDNVK
jgi:carbamate kinase